MYSNLVHNGDLATSTFSSQDGAPQAQICELDEKTRFYGFRYLKIFSQFQECLSTQLQPPGHSVVLLARSFRALIFCLCSKNNV